MSNIILSPNMNLPVPVPSVDPGPDYAFNENACFLTLDGHNHSPGSGVQINPNGLNINSDLSFSNNNATILRSVRFNPQSAILTLPTDLGCIYEVGVDLYINDGNGVAIRVTQGGALAGAAGTITGLPSGTASASYVAGTGTFVWQQATNTAANMDMGSLIIRYPGSYPTPAGNFIIIEAPTSLATGYAITLPALPLVSSVLTLGTTGTMGTQTYDQVGQNMTSTGANAIAASRTRTTGTTVGLGGVAISAGTGTFVTSNSSHDPIPGTAVTITTSGRPIYVCLQPDPNVPSSNSNIGGDNSTTGSDIRITGTTTPQSNVFASTSQGIRVPPGSFVGIFPASAGTYTFSAQLASIASSLGDTASVIDIVLVAYEL